jgi:hypothetical protein
MAGSNKYFIYVSDDGLNWAMLADESNTEAIVADDAAIDVTPANLADHRYKVPGNVEKRFATYKSLDGLQTRKIYVPTVALYQDLATATFTDTLGAYTDAAGTQFFLSGLSPERIRPVTASVDTGLLDGDAD